MNEVKPYQLYQHYKGNEYVILKLATHTETNEPLVIYQEKSNYLSDKMEIWARPLSMFCSYTKEGIKRFILIQNDIKSCI